MTPELSIFSIGSQTELGVFYPRGYLVAVFPDKAVAEHAQRLLHFAGFPEDQAIAFSGREVLGLMGQQFKREGLWGLLMRELSRFFATEEFYTDYDLELAAKGAGFIAVHCPTEASKRKAWEILRPLSPLVARHYALSGIDHLIGEA